LKELYSIVKVQRMITENIEKVLTAKLRIKNNSANLLVKHKGFFFRYCDKPLYHRSSLSHALYDPEIVWSLFSTEIMRIYLFNAKKFLQNDHFDFLKAIISLDEMSGPDFDFNTITWVGEANFIESDTSNARYISGGVACSFGVLSKLEYYETLPKIEAYKWRELMFALTKDFDTESNTFRGNWEELLNKRVDTKKVRKSAYIDQASGLFTPRQLGKAFRDRKPLAPKSERGKPRISIIQWNKIIRYFTAKLLKLKGLKTSAQATENLLSIRGNVAFFSTLEKEIRAELTHYSLPFIFEPEEIKNMLENAYSYRMRLPTIKDKAFFMSNKLILKDQKRFNRMKMPNKTKQLLTALVAYDGFYRYRLTYSHTTLYDFVVCLNNLKIPHKQVRPLLKSLYMNDIQMRGSKSEFGGGVLNPCDIYTQVRAQHDTLVNISSLFNFFNDLEVDDKYSRKYGKIAEILISNINGGLFNQNSINKLSELKSIINEIDHKEFNSIASLTALIEKKKLGGVDVIALAGEKGFIVKDDDEDLVMGSGMPLQILEYLNTLRSSHILRLADFEDTGIIHHSISETLTVSILPYNHLKGVMGASVPGVCINFGSTSHLQHLIPECRNLIVYDKHSIFLWGLLVESKEGAFLLNNLQGSLPSRHVNHKVSIKDSIIKVLGVLGKVYTPRQSFNAMLITDGLPMKEAHNPYRQVELDDKITLPQIRLDVNMDNGSILVSGMHYVEKSVGEPKKREAGLSSLMSRILPSKKRIYKEN
jgi:hypothetical protein